MENADKVNNTMDVQQDKIDDSQETMFNVVDDSNNTYGDRSVSPVYEPETITIEETESEVQVLSPTNTHITISSDSRDESHSVQSKRKLGEEIAESVSKIQKLDYESSQALDEEVSSINSVSKYKLTELSLLSTSRIGSPVRSSPRLRHKRSNSTDDVKSYTPKKATKSRSVSPNISGKRTPQRKQIKDKSSVDLPKLSEKSLIDKTKNIPETIEEENSYDVENDSQNIHLELSPQNLYEEKSDEVKGVVYCSDPVVPKDRTENLEIGKIHRSQSEGYVYSDPNGNSIPITKDLKEKTTDHESTDSVDSTCCMGLESPDNVPNVASKLISKLSNGNSSTPTEIDCKRSDSSDSTPDMLMLNNNKGKRGKNESFRVSNSTTPSTISPLQNGHSLPVNTPQIPMFDIHMSHNEDGEFLSVYIVRTDNDLGVDMCKEYQRFSKRFTVDPYLGDISNNTSPSSVTSGGMINLPNRASFVSTVSSTSTSSSNRTSDGAFVVPQPPRKSISNPTTSIKGYDSLLKKLHDIFGHLRESTIDEGNRSSSDDKVSVAVQVSPSSENTLSNGNASPDEVEKCDKATPKSSLKKTRVRGRRPLSSKTKRAILPTQPEESEWQGLNSPEMIPTNGEGKKSPKSPKEEKPLPSLPSTPKSVSKLKHKRLPNSPRPATPVEKGIPKQEYPGYAPDTVVLARWVDKRYYSGKVLEITEPNKYLIKFDDGQSKVLIDDFIIFGDEKILPLQGQSVYAMVDEEQNYEPGLVLGVEENESGTVTYRCTTDGDTVVMVTASELYLTEDQARSLVESRTRTPPPNTPRRRHHRELDLDNIIQGPRSARSRDKAGNSSARKRINSPKSPKASTSGVKSTIKATPGRKRLASESSEISESSNSAPPARIEEVAGTEPEVQKTPRKLDGVVKAGPLQLKGAAKQNIGKKNSKLNKFENDEDTVTQLGPIPTGEKKIFTGLHFLLTCAEVPKRIKTEKETRNYSSEEDGEATSVAGTDVEDLEFTDRPFNKERLKEQLESGGGIVYSHFDDIPKNKYAACKLIAPRPCLTAKYIQCLAADIRSLSHLWVIMSCANGCLLDFEPYLLPAGYATIQRRFINWAPVTGKRNATFKDKTILLCGDQEMFVKFWERVCTSAGATTKVVNEDDLNMSGAIALVTEWDCPHEVQNKANQDNIPLVSTHWIIQCLIEATIISPTSHVKFSFMYTEPE